MASWLNLALKEAHKSKVKHRLGAVIVKGGRVLSKGHNQIRHNKLHAMYPHSLHAEMCAIKNSQSCGHDLTGASMYVGRIMKNGGSGIAKPCKFCMAQIRKAGIKAVWWTSEHSP